MFQKQCIFPASQMQFFSLMSMIGTNCSSKTLQKANCCRACSFVLVLFLARSLSLCGVGSQKGILKVAGHGSFACLVTNGCTFLSISNIQLDFAREEHSSVFSAIEVAGALLIISDITLYGSWSGTDGGSVRVYAGSIAQG